MTNEKSINKPALELAATVVVGLVFAYVAMPAFSVLAFYSAIAVAALFGVSRLFPGGNLDRRFSRLGARITKMAEKAQSEKAQPIQ